MTNRQRDDQDWRVHSVMEEDTDTIDLSYYLYLLNKNKWQILMLTGVVTLLTILVSLQLTPIYEGTATLLVETQKGKLIAIDEVYGLDTANTNYLQTQMKIIESRDMAKKVVSSGRFDFDRFPEFSPVTAPVRSLFNPAGWFAADTAGEDIEVDRQAIIRSRIPILRNGLSVRPVRGTNLLLISYRSPNPDLAAQIPNLVGEVYIEAQLEAKLEMTEKATSWLTERLDDLRKNLAASEEALQRFQEQEKLVESKGGSVREFGLNELQKIEDELNQSRTRRLELERLVSEIERLGREAPDSLKSHPAILGLDSIKEARRNRLNAENEVRILAERYGPRHPKMIAARTTLKGAEEQLDLQVLVEIENIRKELRAVQAGESNLQNAQGNARSGLQTIRRKEFQLAELKRNVETDRQLYQTFFTRFKETDATQGLHTANARISDPAVVPSTPIAPNKRRIVTLAAFLSFLFACVIAWLRDYLDNTLRTPFDIEHKLAVNVLGVLPLLKAADGAKTLNFAGRLEGKPFNYFAESMRTIRTGVILSGIDSPHKVLVITSSVPGEGKTTVSCQLALALGQMEKVLLIDADMRRPSIGPRYGIAADAPGLSELLAGVKEEAQCIIATTEQGMDVLPAGSLTPNPLELVSSKKFASLLDALQRKYDRLILDSPPSQVVSDALVLSTLSSAVIYVVKADATSHQLANMGLRRLREVGAPVTGVVLNQFDAETARKYHYLGRYQGYESVSYEYRDYSSEPSESSETESMPAAATAIEKRRTA